MTLTILIALVVLVTSVVASALLAPSGWFIERDAFRRQFRGPLEEVIASVVR
jgi:ABC-type transport system involved in cytochrome bd biosynthesis fused ATPase/permease subunit